MSYKATGNSELRYGPDGSRTRQWGSDGARIYIGKGFEKAGTLEKVYVGDYAVVTRNGSTRTVDYLIKDRLGSVDAVVNSIGTVMETRGYDAFGKPRQGNWADALPPRLSATAVGNTRRGFTQHEHLNQLELIHMNGRVYDYNLGRFLSVDPIIQFPDNSQSLNPYSYILNNPLSGTDPTGYCMAETGTKIKSCVNVTANFTDGSSKSLGSFNTRSGGDMARASGMAIPGLGGNGNQSRSQGPTGAGGRAQGQQPLSDKLSIDGHQATLFAQNDAPPPSSLSPAMQRLFPRGDIMRAAGEALGADAAYAVGLATGDQALQDTALDGMRENVTGGDGANAAMMLLSPRSGGKSFTTYTRAKPDGPVYSGRTSGSGTPEQQVSMRTSSADHQARTQQGYGPAIVDKNSPNAAAIRGREQQLIRQHGGAQSQGGTSGNAINGVSPRNRKGPGYERACNAEFGCK